MTTLYSSQYTSAYITEPKSKLEPKELNGRVRRIFATITLSQEIDTTDVVKLAKLPANATPIEARLVAPGGSAGVLQVGWSAGSEGNEAADADGLMGAIDASAAVDDTLSWSDAGFNKKFSESVDIELSATTLTADWDGDAIQFELRYIID